jgi:hypothetical protein
MVTHADLQRQIVGVISGLFGKVFPVLYGIQATHSFELAAVRTASISNCSRNGVT